MIQPQQDWGDLQAGFEQAIAHPELADLNRLWEKIEQYLSQLSREEKLRVAGEAIAQLAEICYARAEWMWTDWDKRWSNRPTEEPILSDDMLSGFLRQTMSLNLDEILDEFTFTRSRTTPDDSIAGEVEKQAVLDWLEHEEKDRALAVAHDENVSEWIGMIREILHQHSRDIQFTQLVNDIQQQHSQMSGVAIWLALLLGGFYLQGEEDFYSNDFRVLHTICHR